jgi:hypothetical protein
MLEFSANSAVLKPIPPRCPAMVFDVRSCRLFSRVLALVFLPSFAAGAQTVDPVSADLDRRFGQIVQPFVQTYCVTCHGPEKQEADLDLSLYSSLANVIVNYGHWDLVLERLETAEMPPDKAKKFPSDEARREVVEWIAAMRRHESHTATRGRSRPGARAPLEQR